MNIEQERVVRSGTALYPAALGLDDFEAADAAAIAVMIASERRDLRAAWLSKLARVSGIEIRGEPLDATCLAARVERYQPDVLLLDKALLDRLDPQSLQMIHAQTRRVRVLLLCDEPCPGLVADVLRNRFHGLLLGACLPEVCLKAIRAVSQGELWLSRQLMAEVITDAAWPLATAESGASSDPDRVLAMDTLTQRELQVVARLHLGSSNKEIARDLGIMEDTVKKHLRSVFAKLGVRRRALVVLLASAPSLN